MLTSRLFVTLVIALIFATSAPHRSVAMTDRYDPAYLISDAEFANAAAMSCEQIQAFLNDKPGILKSLVENDRTAAQHIFAQAVEFNINPHLLLVMIQKEMRMVTDPAPDGAQLYWSAGCGPGWESTRGFANQMRCVAKTLRRNFDRPYISGTIDGVAPRNQGTLALYRYTTHVQGNRLFWRIWTDWWPSADDSPPSAAPASAATGEIVIDSRQVELTPNPGADPQPCKFGWATTSSGSNGHHWLTPAVRTQNESTNFAVWRPNLAAPGRYRVFAFISSHPGRVAWECGPMPARSDTRNAIYLIQHRDGVARVTINQAPLFDAWADLGTYTFDAGPASYVLLSDLTGEATNSAWVNIDDVKFVPTN